MILDVFKIDLVVKNKKELPSENGTVWRDRIAETFLSACSPRTGEGDTSDVCGKSMHAALTRDWLARGASDVFPGKNRKRSPRLCH